MIPYDEWLAAARMLARSRQMPRKMYLEETGPVAYKCGLTPMEFAWFEAEIARPIVGYEDAPFPFHGAPIMGAWRARAVFGPGKLAMQSRTCHAEMGGAIADLIAVFREAGHEGHADFIEHISKEWM